MKLLNDKQLNSLDSLSKFLRMRMTQVFILNICYEITPIVNSITEKNEVNSGHKHRKHVK